LRGEFTLTPHLIFGAIDRRPQRRILAPAPLHHPDGLLEQFGEKIASTLSWLHSLKNWSLHDSWGGSERPSGDAGLRLKE
jgi:hypothetical protein